MSVISATRRCSSSSSGSSRFPILVVPHLAYAAAWRFCDPQHLGLLRQIFRGSISRSLRANGKTRVRSACAIAILRPDRSLPRSAGYAAHAFTNRAIELAKVTSPRSVGARADVSGAGC